jgi:hypothetical protein
MRVLYHPEFPTDVRRYAEPYNEISPALAVRFRHEIDLNSIRPLPKSTERLKWNRDALRESDAKLEAQNRKFRDAIFEACYQIIDSNGRQYVPSQSK